MSKAAVGTEKKIAEPKVHVVQKVIGADTYLVMADSALQIEDEFSNLYFTTQSSSNVVIQPPFVPKVLARLPNQNNTLSQCIEAMEVNIDGTGHEFMPADPDGKVDPNEEQMAKEFFDEPIPGRSFLQLRRKLRRDLESIGYGFLEVLRSVSGDVLAIRSVEGHMMRFVKLDDPVLVTKKMQRGGKEIDMSMWDRERRYVQKVGQKTIYYREFGTTREVNRNTGDWVKDGEALPADQRGTELIAFGVNPDIGSPYSVPRWINQLPSVLGSRKAEEANLEFFDAGGMPPAIIFVQGGALAASASDQLRGYLSGKSKNRQRAVVVEAQSTSGTLEKGGGVQITVERFGSQTANDSMYQKYDVSTEEHVRAGFRLPKLFLGRSDDYNYATAVVAYMVAEEQVFRPERIEFDETINKTILKAMGFKSLRFVSKPITLKNVDNQLKALEMLKGMVKDEDYVQEVASVGGVNLVYDEETANATKELAQAAIDAQKAQPAQPTAPEKNAAGKPPTGTQSPAKLAVVKKAESRVITLARDYASTRGLLAVKAELSDIDIADMHSKIEDLSTDEMAEFNLLIASWAFGSTKEGVIELAGCCH
jgi:PBSX family phage portal protein